MEGDGAAPKQLISGLKAGEKVDSYFSVNYKKPVTEYRYGSMFEFRVADMSGQVTVKYWGGQEKDFVEAVQDSIDPEDVVRVVGEAVKFRDQIEISISEKNGGVVKRLERGQYDPGFLVKSYDDIDGMRTRLLELASSVKDGDLARLLDAFFSDPGFVEEFSKAPASIQLHSAGIGGLLHHTLNVAGLVLKACELYPDLRRDLALAGALLHDIGKVESFRVTSNINQTLDGNLLGHITLGDQELVRRISALDGFPSETASKMRHMILAHHGRKEWGSPVEPMFPEALLVHEADDLDARLDNITTKLREAATSDEWIWDHRNARRIYRK